MMVRVDRLRVASSETEVVEAPNDNQDYKCKVISHASPLVCAHSSGLTYTCHQSPKRWCQHRLQDASLFVFAIIQR